MGRDTLKEVIRLQLQSANEGQLAECQEQLLQHYESYRANFGPLNNISTAKLFEDDPEYPLLTALENIDPETSRISLADIFTKRTIRPYEPLRELPSDPKAAMLQVLAECGRLDTGLMSRLLDKPEADVIGQLVAADLIYKEPNSQQYQTADEYLSGNVRQKLKDAQGATLLDPAYERNVKALEAVQPEIVPFIDIDVRLGQTWVPSEVYAAFLNRHLAEQRPASCDRAPSITRDLNGRWSVDLPSCYNTFELTHKWAGGGMSGHKLLEYGLNLQEPTLYENNADGKPVIDTVRTIAARAKLREIKDAFSEWVKGDKQADIHPQIERIYNETFNANRLRIYDGGHLTFPGLNSTINPRPYQMRGAWRVMVEGRALLDHFVGSGKSLSVIIAGMESRRIGISRKNLYVVPNNMIQQWREEFKKAYPSANVLAVTERDFDSPLSRKRLFSRVATNEWDAVIVPHSQFDMLPISPEREAKTVNAQIQEMKDLLREGAENGRTKTRAEKRTTRQIENKIQKYKEKLKELSQGRKDDTIYFDDLGVDRLFVDEAHAYKALAIVTKMGNIAGISTRESQRAQRILAKIEFMQETHNGAGVKAHDLQRAQLLERKQTFLSQFKSGGRMGRKIEDIAGETRLSPQIFALAKAQATGNPLALEKIKLEYEIKNLTLLARANRLDHYNNRQQLLNVEYRIAHLQDRLPQLRKASETFKSHEKRDDEGKLLSLQVRFNGLEFIKLKDTNEYLRTVTLDSTTQLTVNGLDIPLAVSDALIKDELGAITDITAVRYNLAGEWFDVPRPDAHMGLPSAQSLLTSVLRRGGDLPSKILETEASILENESTLTRLHTALGYQSPYETKLKEYEQRLAEIDKELLGKTEEVEELVDAETEGLSSSKTLSVDQEITDNNEIVRAETVEDRSRAQVAVDDAPGETLEVAAMQTPRLKRRQTADRGR